MMKENADSFYEELRRFNIISRNFVYVYSFDIMIAISSLMNRFF